MVDDHADVSQECIPTNSPSPPFERCLTCLGTGEVRAVWAVTKWRMAPCEECGGTGKVPETDVNSLLVEHTSQDFVDSLIQRGVFMLRMRDIDEIWNEGYETAKEQNRSGMLLQEDPELYNDLLEEAKRYERVVPNSPKGELLRRAAERCIKPVSNEDTV